jgi:hypothetical protein
VNGLEQDGGELEYDYDLVASYAPEDRDEVQPILLRLEELDVRVYDREGQPADLWGRNMVEYLPQVIRHRSRFTVPFVSAHYAAGLWTTVERQAAQTRALEQRTEFLLPIRLDDTELPGLLPTVGHLDLRKHGVEKICEAVVQKLAQHRSAFTFRTPVNANSVSSLLREKPAGWEYLLYTAVVWQGWHQLENKYRDHFLRYAPLNGVVEHGKGLESIQNRNIMLTELITTTRETFSDEKRKGLFGGPGDPDEIIHFGTTFVRIFGDFLEWARDIHGTSYALRAARDAARLQARFADTQLLAMHSTVQELRSTADTLVERVATGQEIDTGIDTAALEINLESPLGFKIEPELAAAYLAAIDKVKRRR